jgi:hypothetical protein
MAGGDKSARINKAVDDFKRGKFIDYFVITNYYSCSYSFVLKRIRGFIKSKKKTNFIIINILLISEKRV